MRSQLLEKKSNKTIDTNKNNQKWPWWPLLPLYPYGRKRTFFKELIPKLVWSFEQLQGLYYVAVPIRLTVLKVQGGLMLFNPLPPTKELLEKLNDLIETYGPVKTIVLPTASGLEHKISLPSLARCFPNAQIWICPGQWSFPFSLPLKWLGIPPGRTKVLIKDGYPHEDSCKWISLGPLNIGLGRFQEIACYHNISKSLLVTDAIVGISDEPPELFSLDPTPLLFHSREQGNEMLIDSTESRKKGWARLVLFASFLRPYPLSIPNLSTILLNSFKPGLRNARSHFGVYPFAWDQNWNNSLDELVGKNKPLLQVAPVIERLIFPRAKDTYMKWLDELTSLKGMKWLISSHYNAPIPFSSREVKAFSRKISKREWAKGSGNWKFLGTLDNILLKKNIVPTNPLQSLKD